MSKAKFNTLIRHLDTTGQYKPLVVRKHPLKENAWQLLNGHHRVRALRQLKHTHADCVVFGADDAQSRMQPAAAVKNASMPYAAWGENCLAKEQA